MSVKRGKVSLLSFQNDDDDAEDETVVIKSKIGKKQRQLAYRKYNDEIAAHGDRTESVIHYDEDELHALRQSQLYVKERIAVNEDDDLKDAYILEEVIKEIDNEDEENGREIITQTINEVEIQEEVSNKLKNSTKKVFFSDSVKTSMQSRREEIEREIQDTMDVGQEDEALNASILKNSIGYTPTSDSVGSAMSMQTILKLVGNSLDKLAGIHGSNKDNVSRIVDALDGLVRSNDKLSEDITTTVSTLNDLLELQLFITEVVSMLREKVGLLKAYKSEYLTLISNSYKEIEGKYYIKQEDLLYILQQKGEVVDFNCGTYQCQHILNSLGVDEFGRMLTEPNLFKRRSDAYFPSLMAGATIDSITLSQLLHGINGEVAAMVGESAHPMLCTIMTESVGDDTILDKIRHAFGDCKSELYSITHILSKFQQFKSGLLTEYNRAFISYSLPGLLLPLIEYDLVVSIRDGYVINEREWHHAVHQYSMDRGQKAGDNIDDQLLSTMVTTSSLLFLQELIMSGLHVLNRQHCLWLGQFLQQVIQYNPSPSQLDAVASEITAKFNLFWTNKLLFPVLKATPAVSIWGCYYYHRSFNIVHQVMCNLEYLLPVLKPEVIRDMVCNLLFGNKNVLAVVIRVLNTAVDVDGGILPCLVRIGQLLALIITSVGESDRIKKKHLVLYVSTMTSTVVSVTETVKMLRDISSQY